MVNKQEEQKVTGGDVALGLAGIGGGAAVANKHLDRFTGLERKFHGTNAKHVDSIKENGILSSKAGESAASQRAMGAGTFSQKDIDGTVYLGNKKKISDQFAMQEGIRNLGFESGSPQEWLGRRMDRGEIGQIREDRKKIKEGGSVLKVNIPYEDLKKMNVIGNPEIGGRTPEEFSRHLHKLMGGSDEQFDAVQNPVLKYLRDTQGRAAHNMLERDTTTIEGDVDAKYIKGSRHYQGYNPKQMFQYIKNNPGRFGRGAAGVAAGTGLAGFGASRFLPGEEEQLANEIHAYMEKQAKGIGNFVRNVTGKNVQNVKKGQQQFINDSADHLASLEGKLTSAAGRQTDAQNAAKQYIQENKQPKRLFRRQQPVRLPEEMNNELFDAHKSHTIHQNLYKDVVKDISEEGAEWNGRLYQAGLDQKRARKQAGGAAVLGTAGLAGGAVVANRLNQQEGEQQLANEIYDYFEKTAAFRRTY